MPSLFLFKTKKMQIHKNWSVTKKGLEKLHKLSEEELKELIKSKNLYRGFPTEIANKRNAEIYGKINNLRTDKKVRKTNTSKAKKRNRKDS